MKLTVNGDFSSSLIEAVPLIIAGKSMCFEPQVYCLRLDPDGNYLNPESLEFGNAATLLFLDSPFIREGRKEKISQFLTYTSLNYVFFTLFQTLYYLIYSLRSGALFLKISV